MMQQQQQNQQQFLQHRQLQQIHWLQLQGSEYPKLELVLQILQQLLVQLTLLNGLITTIIYMWKMIN
jgi:hypothetical protein